MIKVIQDDIKSFIETYEGEKFHALLTDPPYELGKKGFMNNTWDCTGISFDKNFWNLFHKVLYPGAFGMAFGGSNTYHRIACAIEDAGFIIHSSIFVWVFSYGIPKTARFDRRIDRMYGQEGIEQNGTYVAVTEEAQKWSGHRYGQQTLRPLAEPIIVFQKPYDEDPLDNITSTGAGALNIAEGSVNGKWPSNFVTECDCDGGTKHGHDCLCGKLNQQQGSKIANTFYKVVRNTLESADPIYHCNKPSRYERESGLNSVELKDYHFNQFGGGDRYHGHEYSGKVKNNHCALKPIKLAKHLASLLLPPKGFHRKIIVPFAGVMSEAIGAEHAGWDEVYAIEKEESYVEIGKLRVDYWTNQAKVTQLGLFDTEE